MCATDQCFVEPSCVVSKEDSPGCLDRTRMRACVNPVTSLSMPDNLQQLALDISAMHHRVSQPSPSPWAKTKSLCRSRSTSQLVDPEDVQAIRAESIVPNPEQEHEYFMGSLDIDGFESSEPATALRAPLAGCDTPHRRSFLPLVFEDCSLIVEDESDDAENPVPPSPTLDEQKHRTPIASVPANQKVELASACLQELLSVIGANEPVEYSQLPGYKCFDQGSAPNKSPCSVIPSGREIDRYPNRRSPARDDTCCDFVKLSQDRRANSMPLPRPFSPRMPLPRKSSLKNISSALSTSSSSSSLKRTVSFNKLLIREYNVELSDHPSCSYGPPIQLGWEFRDQAAMPVEEYEERRLPRRNSNELVLSYNVRRYLLLKRAGYSKQELQRVMDDVKRVKRERLMTDLFLPMMKFDETLEEIVDQIKATFSVKKKREMQQSRARSLDSGLQCF